MSREASLRCGERVQEFVKAVVAYARQEASVDGAREHKSNCDLVPGSASNIMSTHEVQTHLESSAAYGVQQEQSIQSEGLRQLQRSFRTARRLYKERLSMKRVGSVRVGGTVREADEEGTDTTARNLEGESAGKRSGVMPRATLTAWQRSKLGPVFFR